MTILLCIQMYKTIDENIWIVFLELFNVSVHNNCMRIVLDRTRKRCWPILLNRQETRTNFRPVFRRVQIVVRSERKPPIRQKGAHRKKTINVLFIEQINNNAKCGI